MFGHTTSSVNLKFTPLDAPLSQPRKAYTIYIVLDVARFNTVAIGEREDEKIRLTELLVMTELPVCDSMCVQVIDQGCRKNARRFCPATNRKNSDENIGGWWNSHYWK
jgi:hypothetical protein